MEVAPIVIIIGLSIYVCFGFLFACFVLKILKVYLKHKRRENISEANKYFMFRRNDLQYWRVGKKFEFIFGAIFLLPVRLVFLLITSFWLALIIRLFSFFKGFQIVRIFIRWQIRIYAKTMLFLSGFYFIRRKSLHLSDFLSGYGISKNPSFPLVVCNHISWIDSVYLMSRFSGSFLAKKELQKIPVISQIGKFLDLLYLEREIVKDREQIIQDIGSRLTKKNENPLIIFPEGTTSNGTALLTFKKGSFFFMSPLKIVCLKYTRKSFNPGLDHVTGMGTNILMTFCQFYNSLEVFEFETLEPNKLSNVKRWEEYAGIVRKIMGQCLNVKLVEAGYRDSMAYYDVVNSWKKKIGQISKKRIHALEKVLSK